MVITGVIRPPPDIRAVVDRTALFVSKNGRTFEQRILNSAKGKTPKFAFLYESSPFHAYYQSRIKFYEEGGEEAELKEKDQQESSTSESKDAATEESKPLNEKRAEPTESKAVVGATKVQKASIDPVSRELLAQRAIITRILQPTESQPVKANQQQDESSFVQETQPTQQLPQPHPQIAPPAPQALLNITAPANVSPSQLEIMKLTAQFAAFARLVPNESTISNTFLDTLRFREWQNQTTFGFLHARHAHFAYFTALVDGYKRLIQEYHTQDRRDNETDLSEMSAVVPLKRIEMEELQQSIQERDICAQKGVAGCLSVTAFRAEYHQFQIAQDAKRARDDEAEGSSRLGGAAVVDWHDFVVVETIDFPVTEVVRALPPPPPLPKVAAPEPQPKPQEEQYMEVSEDEEEDEGERLKIVSEYIPRVVATTTTAELARTHMVDPITGKSVPVADLTEHMRIQLLDPKWAEEKKRFQEKQRESNLLQGEDIARNVSRFAREKGDMFGATDDELHRQEEGDKKRLDEANSVIHEHTFQQEHTGATLASAIEPFPVAMATADVGSVKRPMELLVHPAISAVVSTAVLDIPPPPPPPLPPAKRVRIEETMSPALPPTMEVSVDAEVPPSDVPEPPLSPVADVPAPSASPEVQAPIVPPDAITLTIRVPAAGPNDPQLQQWGMHGQSIVLEVADAQKVTVKSIKEDIQRQLGGLIPINKMQLKIGRIGFLKDGTRIGEVEGITGAEEVDLVPKVRGGRK